jgi:hypothetical protein
MQFRKPQVERLGEHVSIVKHLQSTPVLTVLVEKQPVQFALVEK